MRCIVGHVKKNGLNGLEIETAASLDHRRKRLRRRHNPKGATRIVEKTKTKERLPPPVPKNKSLKEIQELDENDPQFRHLSGRPRKWHEVDGEVKTKPQTWKDVVRADRQKKANARRARVRKWEAEVTVAQEVMEGHTNGDDHKMDIYDEEKLIAEGVLELDGWDNEELIRGYRRNRDGKFGKAPKYIPREVQQQAFRILVNRGERRMKEAYLTAIEELVKLAHSAQSEKVRLDAQRELLNRVVGKVPDKVLVAHDEPWQDILADSLVPIGDALPIELEQDGEGTWALAPQTEED